MKKFDYYLKLRSLGIKEKHAVSMVKQTSKKMREKVAGLDTAHVAIMQFQTWSNTDEGDAFWYELYDKHQAKEWSVMALVQEP